jgi:hypothetical protein
LSTYQHKLAPAPSDAAARRLWLQHVAGFILFEDAHKYAVSRLPSSLNGAAKEAAMKAIDDTLYGVMMIVEGVTGALGNSDHTVDLHLVVRLCDADNGEPIEALNLRDGDGACMGFHGWREGDFGKVPVAA